MGRMQICRTRFGDVKPELIVQAFSRSLPLERLRLPPSARARPPCFCSLRALGWVRGAATLGTVLLLHQTGQLVCKRVEDEIMSFLDKFLTNA